MEDQKGMFDAQDVQLILPSPVSEIADLSLLQLIKALEEARGNGTSMISLIMPPKDQVWMYTPALGHV